MVKAPTSPPRKSSTCGSLPSLRDPTINIVHLARGSAIRRAGATPEFRLALQQQGEWYAETVIPTKAPQAAALALAYHVPDSASKGPVYDLVVQDICWLAAQFRNLLGVDSVRCKLQAVQSCSCPKWHTDFVRMRAICTYSGAGTMYMDESFVKRVWNWHIAGLGVESVQDEEACQASAGDLLFLKGNNFPGSRPGFGAVHKSPDASHVAPRLMLVMDDDAAHSAHSACSTEAVPCTLRPMAPIDVK